MKTEEFINEKEKVFNIINRSETSIDEWIKYLQELISDMTKIDRRHRIMRDVSR